MRNRNATVEVRYREAGATAWRDALPLLRMGGERIFRAAERLDYTVPNRFAGSILDLKPDTEYECSFTMRDPDGVTGQAIQTAKVRTRHEPATRCIVLAQILVRFHVEPHSKQRELRTGDEQ